MLRMICVTVVCLVALVAIPSAAYVPNLISVSFFGNVTVLDGQSSTLFPVVATGFKTDNVRRNSLRWDNYYAFHALGPFASGPIAARVDLQTKAIDVINFPSSVVMAFPMRDKNTGIIYDLIRHADRSQPREPKYWHELVTLDFDARSYQSVVVYQNWTLDDDFFAYNPDGNVFVYNGGNANHFGQFYFVSASTGNYKPLPQMNLAGFSTRPFIHGSFWDSSAQTFKLLLEDGDLVVGGQSNFTIATYDHVTGQVTLGNLFLFPPSGPLSFYRNGYDGSAAATLFDTTNGIFYVTGAYASGALVYGTGFNGNVVSLAAINGVYQPTQWAFA